MSYLTVKKTEFENLLGSGSAYGGVVTRIPAYSEHHIIGSKVSLLIFSASASHSQPASANNRLDYCNSLISNVLNWYVQIKDGLILSTRKGIIAANSQCFRQKEVNNKF